VLRIRIRIWIALFLVSQIRIRNIVKSRIRIRIISKSWKLWRAHSESWGLNLKAQRLTNGAVKTHPGGLGGPVDQWLQISHLLDEELDPDPDPRQSKKVDPDPHPHQGHSDPAALFTSFASQSENYCTSNLPFSML
jgi:hypothetical protein